MILGAFVYLGTLVGVAFLLLWLFLKAFKKPVKVEKSNRDAKTKALAELVPTTVDSNVASQPLKLSFVLKRFDSLLKRDHLEILDVPTHLRKKLTVDQILSNSNSDADVSETNKRSKKTYRKKSKSFFDKTAEE